MKNTENYFEYTMDDIVFEGRNKKYGAYALRKSLDRFISRALLVTLFIVSALTVYFLTKKVVKPVAEKIITIKPLKPIIFDVKPPVIEIQQQIKPLNPITEAIRKVEVNVVADNQATDKNLPPTTDELKGKTIGLITDSSGIKGNQEPILKGVVGNTQLAGEKGEKNKFSLYAEVMPEFPDLNNWLRRNIRYPQVAIDAGAEGKVFIEFIVNEDGSISDAIVKRGIGFGCDEEALKAVKKMPKWKPGRQQQNPVRVKLTIPVEFKLSD